VPSKFTTNEYKEYQIRVVVEESIFTS
nr:hypothetical protein [Tanacetum cinerariifolium]